MLNGFHRVLTDVDFEVGIFETSCEILKIILKTSVSFHANDLKVYHFVVEMLDNFYCKKFGEYPLTKLGSPTLFFFRLR